MCGSFLPEVVMGLVVPALNVEVVPEALEDTGGDPEAREAKEEAIHVEEVDPKAQDDKETIKEAQMNERDKGALLADGRMTLRSPKR